MAQSSDLSTEMMMTSIGTRKLLTGQDTQTQLHKVILDQENIVQDTSFYPQVDAEIQQKQWNDGIRIEALNLTRLSNKGQVLLHDISLAIPPGKLVGIIGRSGAGKSMLIEALNGLRPAQKGTVLYNGQDYYRNSKAFSTILGYVPQDDTVHRELTVERALYYAARLRLPDSFTTAQIQQRIDEVLEDMEIAHRRKLLVGKLSGGQRKRVSIAIELLARPGIFFLDEPTSGLDPELDRKTMLLLRHLADQGHTVVMSTHAIANIDVCDYVCFMAQGGRLAYFGPPDAARSYFDRENFAEIYATLEPTDDDLAVPEKVEEHFKTSADYQKYVIDLLAQKPGDTDDNISRLTTKKRRSHHSSSWRQFILLTQRSLELLKNSKGNLLVLLLQAPVLALILLLLIRYEINLSIFDTNNIVSCPTTAQIITPTGLVDAPGYIHPPVSMSCSRVVSFLKHTSQGEKYAVYRGGVQKALQSFISPGSGKDAQMVLFIMAFTMIMLGSINAIREIVKEAAIYQRERTVNLGIGSYICSKIVVLGTLCLFQCAVLVVMINAIAPFHQGILFSALLEVFITLAIAALASMMLGLAISAAVPNNDTALSFIPIILVPQVIFSGTIFPLKDLFSQAIGALFAARWAMVALGSSVGLHSDKLTGDKLFGNNYTYNGTLFSLYSQNDAVQHLLFLWGALLLMTVLFGCTIFIAMKIKDVRK